MATSGDDLDIMGSNADEWTVVDGTDSTQASDTDVSDRVYTSSKEIIENNLEEFTEFAKKIGNLARVKNFPRGVVTD